MNIYLWAILAAVGTSLIGCASKDPGKLRDEDPLTISHLGLHYRPTKNWGLGFQGAGTENQTVGWARDDVPYGRELIAKSARRDGEEVNGAILYYPFEKSSFFLGVSGGEGKFKLSFYERAKGDTEEPILVEYVEKDVVIGPAIGWTWMFKYGITLHFDFGPRFQVRKSTWFESGGDGSGVDEAERDATIGKVWSVNKGSFGKNYRTGLALIGISF